MNYKNKLEKLEKVIGTEAHISISYNDLLLLYKDIPKIYKSKYSRFISEVKSMSKIKKHEEDVMRFIDSASIDVRKWFYLNMINMALDLKVFK